MGCGEDGWERAGAAACVFVPEAGVIRGSCDAVKLYVSRARHGGKLVDGSDNWPEADGGGGC